MLDHERRLAGDGDRLEHRFDVALDHSLASQRHAAHRRHLRRERDACRDGAGHLGSDVTMTERQGQAHEIGGEAAVVEAVLPCSLEPPAPQQHVVRAAPVALGLLQPRHRGRDDSRVVAELVALQRVADPHQQLRRGAVIARGRGDDRPVGERLRQHQRVVLLPGGLAAGNQAGNRVVPLPDGERRLSVGGQRVGEEPP